MKDMIGKTFNKRAILFYTGNAIDDAVFKCFDTTCLWTEEEIEEKAYAAYGDVDVSDGFMTKEEFEKHLSKCIIVDDYCNKICRHKDINWEDVLTSGWEKTDPIFQYFYIYFYKQMQKKGIKVKVADVYLRKLLKLLDGVVND